jgi:hypothetical protein
VLVCVLLSGSGLLTEEDVRMHFPAVPSQGAGGAAGPGGLRGP